MNCCDSSCSSFNEIAQAGEHQVNRNRTVNAADRVLTYLCLDILLPIAVDLKIRDYGRERKIQYLYKIRERKSGAVVAAAEDHLLFMTHS